MFDTSLNKWKIKRDKLLKTMEEADSFRCTILFFCLLLLIKVTTGLNVILLFVKKTIAKKFPNQNEMELEKEDENEYGSESVRKFVYKKDPLQDTDLDIYQGKAKKTPIELNAQGVDVEANDVYYGSSYRNEPYYFCTVTGQEYVYKILALYQSLEKSTSNYQLYICCIDDVSYSLLSSMHLPHMIPFPLSQMEDAELAAIKSYRKRNELCWTLKGPIIQHLLDYYHTSDAVYCDGDLYFFTEPKVIYDEWGGNDVYICPQRDLDWVENIYGKYQAGLIGFKNTNNGRTCLKYWRDKCVEWCYNYSDPQNERYGDQKYLDKIPWMFTGVKVSENLGVDAAPWNIIYNNNFNIYEMDNNVYIEKDKLVVFHFATIAIYNEWEFDLWNFNYIPISKIIMNKIYLPYLTSIRENIERVRRVNPGIVNSLFNQNPAGEAKTYYKYPDVKYQIVSDNDETKYFCTMMSKEYLIKGITFYESLQTHVKNFRLWICCMDDFSCGILNGMNLNNVTVIPLSDIEDDAIRQAKTNRKINEFCWTIKAPLVQYILKNYNVDHLLYCDADLFLFSNLDSVYESWKGHSIFICRQRDNYEFEKTHGSYQAGFIGFKNDKESFKILSWWRDKCLEWCYDDPQPQYSRWGDQKYLDSLPMNFSGIMLDNQKGINAAPWNVIYNNNYSVTSTDNRVWIDQERLVFYHFGSMYLYNDNEFDLWKLRPLTINTEIILYIYMPYFVALKDSINKIKPYCNGLDYELFIDKNKMPPVNYFYFAEVNNV